MLELDGIDKKTLEKLDKAGFTIGNITISNVKELVTKIKVDPSKARQIIDAAQDQLGLHPVTASQFLEIENKRGRITTGSNEFDSMMNGGVWTGELTELVGSFSSGKTQLCFQLCVNVQLPEERGGLGGKAFFIDTERTFSPQRVQEIASYRFSSKQTVLDDILVARSPNSELLATYVNQLDELIVEKNIKLVIIDSLASHFRSEFIGKDKLVERQQKIMSLAEKLTALAVNYDIAIVVTNQIIAAIDQFLYGTAEEPALGFAWGHRPQQRIFLRKSRGSGRIARLFDSSRFPEREILFYVTEQGIADSPPSMDFY